MPPLEYQGGNRWELDPDEYIEDGTNRINGPGGVRVNEGPPDDNGDIPFTVQGPGDSKAYPTGKDFPSVVRKVTPSE